MDDGEVRKDDADKVGQPVRGGRGRQARSARGGRGRGGRGRGGVHGDFLIS